MGARALRAGRVQPESHRVPAGKTTLQRSKLRALTAGSHIDFRFAWPYPSSMNYQHLITIEPGKRGGKPCIRGMRITVYDVLEYLASGMSGEEILSDFPDLTREDIRACLAFAADRERKFVSIPPT